MQTWMTREHTDIETVEDPINSEHNPTVGDHRMSHDIHVAAVVMFGFHSFPMEKKQSFCSSIPLLYILSPTQLATAMPIFQHLI